MQISNFFSRQNKNRKTVRQVRVPRKRNSRSSINGYQSLEARKMLASFVANGDVTVNFEGDRPASIEIEGTTFINPDATLDVTFEESGPSEIKLRGGNGHNVLLGNRITTVDDSVIFDYSSISFLDLDFYTGDGDDTIEEDGSFHFDLQSGGHRVFAFAEGGNDLFVQNGGSVGARMGDGDDTIIGFTSGHYLFDGGAGKDKITLSGNSNRDLMFDGENLRTIFNGASAFTNYRSWETYEFDELENKILVEDGSRTIINKESAWYFASPESSPVRFINAQNFGAAVGAKATFQVIETGNPLYFSDDIQLSQFGEPDPNPPRGFGTVIIGGAFNNGDTSKITHDIFLGRVNSLVVTNSSATEGQQVSVSADSTHRQYDEKITGLTPSTLFVADVSHATLAGSNVANDRFVVSHSDSHLVLFGNGGDDVFLVGYQNNGSGSDIGQAGNFINVLGGGGDDFVRINDQHSDLARYYRVRESSVFPSGNSPDNTFKGVWHRAERVELIASDADTRFYLSPTFNSQVTISVGEQDRDPQATFFLFDPRPASTQFITSGLNTFAWWFGDNSDAAKFYSMKYRPT